MDAAVAACAAAAGSGLVADAGGDGYADVVAFTLFGDSGVPRDPRAIPLEP